MQETLRERSAQNQNKHAAALTWLAQLTVPHGLGWLEWRKTPQTAEGATDRAVAQAALHALFDTEGFPAEYAEPDLRFLRDPLGKPYLTWHGVVNAWAEQHGRHCRHLHVSNTHDGDYSLVLAAYAEDLVGIGIDLVHLPRLERIGRDGDYLRRFARRFMSEAEWEAFEAAATFDTEMELRTRVAAHFSLMESASKACGTGLKIGGGMGRSTSLSKYALGVRCLSPTVELLFDTEARTRLDVLGAARYESYWDTDGVYLISAVLLRS